jgi:hypothetical protein
MKYFCLLLMCWSIALCNAQTDKINLGLISTDQLFIKEATDSAVFILKQEYVMKDTANNQTYPMPDKNYFGKAYALAIMIDTLLWTDAKLFTPWLNDTNYLFYKERYGFIPELTTLYYRPLYNNGFAPCHVNHISGSPKSDSLLQLHAIKVLKPLNMPTTNLSAIYNTNNADGWAFFVASQNHIYANDSCAIKYAIYKAKPDFDKNAELFKQPDMPFIIGGFYIMPQTKTGSVSFFAAGYLKKLIKWYVKPIPEISFHIDNTSKNTVIPNNTNEPKKEKKRKKRKNN